MAAALVTAAMAETDTKASEAQLHAVGYAFDLPLSIVQPLTALLAGVDKEQLGYCLDILAATHDRAIEPTIAQFVDDPDPDVRTSAKEALVELRGRS